ncbi:NAD(P)-binding protein, partial [Aureobasidium melanogenum]
MPDCEDIWDNTLSGGRQDLTGNRVPLSLPPNTDGSNLEASAVRSTPDTFDLWWDMTKTQLEDYENLRTTIHPAYRDLAYVCLQADVGIKRHLQSRDTNRIAKPLYLVPLGECNLYGPQKNWENGLGGPVDGVLRQYIAVPASSVVRVPAGSGVSTTSWASIVCTGVTAWNCFYGNIPLRPGQTVLFQARGSMTGLQIAKNAGAITVVTSSSDSKLQFVKEQFGAHPSINYKTANWAEEAQKLTSGRGVDYILENSGSGTIKQSLDATAMGGIISVVGFLSATAQEDMPDVAGLALSKGAVVRGITMGSTQLLEEAM